MTIQLEEAKRYFSQGLDLMSAELFSDAHECFRKSAALAPGRPSILINLAASLIQLQRWTEAKSICEDLINDNPNDTEALLNLGICYVHLDKENLAHEQFNKAIELNPQFSAAWCNKGNLHLEKSQFSLAEKCFQKALDVNPESPESYIGRANLRNERCEYNAALNDLELALRYAPNNAQAQWNKALSLLRLGNYEEGWALYESRWRISGIKEHLPKIHKPIWFGKDSLQNKVLLVSAEQGFGDTIQFCRYLPKLAQETGAKIILEVPEPLTQLMSSLKHEIKVVKKGTLGATFIEEEVDFIIPIMSFPNALHTTLESIPNQVPYLFPQENSRVWWKQKLKTQTESKGLKHKPIRVGICWHGSGHYASNKNTKRDIPFTTIEPFLLNICKKESIEFHALNPEISGHPNPTPTLQNHLYFYSKDLKNFSDTAGLMAEMDLIVSIDTATMHLAGALGIRTLLLLPTPPDFMFLNSGQRTPWYPSVSIYRQLTRGDWNNPLSEIEPLILNLAHSNQ